MSETKDLNQEISYDAPIENDGQEFELLPAGTYDFTVESMERGRYEGSEKMCACGTVNLTLVMKSPSTGNDVKVFDTLYMNRKAEWRISEFLRGIGQKKHGEPCVPRWNDVPCSKGKCEIEVNSYTDKNGNQKQNNKVKKYLDFEPSKWAPGKF
jgi:hypothetical protein